MEDPLADILAASSSSSTPSSSSQAYLTYLTTLSLPDLIAEPTSLQTQSHHLTSSLTSLTHSSYPTFISLHRTTTSLTESLNSLSSSLSSLLDISLPALEQCAVGWRDKTENILKERNKARVVLEQGEKIKDLLDVPVLIDTCVRNGYFAEALALAAHASSVASVASRSNPKSSPQTPTTETPSPPLILSSVLAEVHHSMTQMLLSLLATLHEPNKKLPVLWKAVNFLRKMDAFGPNFAFEHLSPTHLNSTLSKNKTSVVYDHRLENLYTDVTSEEQLALAFLSGRSACLASSVDPIARDIFRIINARDTDSITTPVTPDSSAILAPARVNGTARKTTLSERDKEDVARYLRKYIDIWRECVYDIVTQYSSIFLEQPHSTIASTTSSFPSSHLNSLPSPSFFTTTSNLSAPKSRTDLHATLLPLLTTHTTHTLHKYLLPLLTQTLPHLSLPYLPSLLTQLTYCATAFERVGLDFRPLLSAPFVHAVVSCVDAEAREAVGRWTARVRGAWGNGGRRGSVGVKDPPSKWLIVPSHAPSSSIPPPYPTPTQPRGPAHVPPQVLASYPPLAEFTNDLLGVLNALRLLAPVTALPELVCVLEDALGEGGEALGEYIKVMYVQGDGEPWTNGKTGVIVDEQDGQAEGEKESRIALAVGGVYFYVFVPFMRRALVEGVFSMQGEETVSEYGDKLADVLREWESWTRKGQ